MIAFYIAGIVDRLDLLAGDRVTEVTFESREGDKFSLPVSSGQLEIILGHTFSGEEAPEEERVPPPPTRSPTRAAPLSARGRVDEQPVREEEDVFRLPSPKDVRKGPPDAWTYHGSDVYEEESDL